MSNLPTLDLLQVMAAGNLKGVSVADTVWFKGDDVVGLFMYDDRNRSVKFDENWPPISDIAHDSKIEAQRRHVFDLLGVGESLCDIVATLILPQSVEEGQPRRATVDYLTAERLQQFLYTGSVVGDCLLSRFVVPSVHHSLVYCVYGEGKVLGMEHRVNKNKIHDQYIPVFKRTCTAAGFGKLSYQSEMSKGTIGRLQKIVDTMATGAKMIGCKVNRMSLYFSITPPVAGGVVGRYVLLCASESPALPRDLPSYDTLTRSTRPKAPVVDDDGISWGNEHVQHPASASQQRTPSERRALTPSVRSRAGTPATHSRPLSQQEIRERLRTSQSRRLRQPTDQRVNASTATTLLNKSNVRWDSLATALREPLPPIASKPGWNASMDRSTVIGDKVKSSVNFKPQRLGMYGALADHVRSHSPEEEPLRLDLSFETYVHDLQDACLMGYLTRAEEISGHRQGPRKAVPQSLVELARSEAPLSEEGLDAFSNCRSEKALNFAKQLERSRGHHPENRTPSVDFNDPTMARHTMIRTSFKKSFMDRYLEAFEYLETEKPRREQEVEEQMAGSFGSLPPASVTPRSPFAAGFTRTTEDEADYKRVREILQNSEWDSSPTRTPRTTTFAAPPPEPTLTPRHLWIKRHFDPIPLSALITESFYEVYSDELVTNMSSPSRARREGPIQMMEVKIADVGQPSASEAVAWLKYLGIVATVDGEGEDLLITVPRLPHKLAALRTKMETHAKHLDEQITGWEQETMVRVVSSLQERCECTPFGSLQQQTDDGESKKLLTRGEEEAEPQAKVTIFEGLLECIAALDRERALEEQIVELLQSPSAAVERQDTIAPL